MDSDLDLAGAFSILVMLTGLIAVVGGLGLGHIIKHFTHHDNFLTRLGH